jgi:ribosomal-protein-alanine N-acetyltransferase
LPWLVDDRPEVEVAYMIGKSFWGQGLGTEAAQAVLEYGFNKLQLTRLICLIDRDNQASLKVAQKIGMQFEREGEDDKGPFLLYTRQSPSAPGRPGT